MTSAPDSSSTLPQIAALAEQLGQPHADLTEQVQQQQEQVLRGDFLQVVRDTVHLPDGSSASREYVQHPGAVVIVPMLDDGRLLLELQYRHPMRRVMVEFPAGKLEAAEPGLACAQRELREETGFVAREWAFAGSMHNCIAYSDERIDIWFARGLAYRGQQLEAGELLHVVAATLPELAQHVQQGQLTDAKTITCLWWLQQMRQGAWQPAWQAVAP